MGVNEEDQENYYITCPECRGENQAPNCEKCGGLRKVPRVPVEHPDEVAISLLTAELVQAKEDRDLFLQQIKELNQAMDDSKIEVRQCSMYHLSIKKILKENS